MSTENGTMKHVSSSPHLRNPLTTGNVMLDVIYGLLPVTFFGIWHFGPYAALVIIASIVSAVATESVFNYITKRPNTVWDCSAVLTGLLLALCLPSRCPIYVPVIGSMFGILVAKCFFGGLGQNFMNPALAGRAFLLISFGKVMTNYSYDAVGSVTPLAAYNGSGSVSLLDMFLGFATGHIGISVICILIGGIWLLATDTISWEVPVASTLSFWFFLIVMGDKGIDPYYLAVEFCGGGFALGAFFMATDPVTNPMTWSGQLIFGCLYGFLSAVFRTKGSMADTTTFAIIIANMATPLIDRMPVPHPFGVGKKGASTIPSLEELAHPKKKGIPKSAVILMAITLIAGGGLACVYMVTSTTIAENERKAAFAAYESVLPGMEITSDDEITAKVEEFRETGYGDGAFGRVFIHEAVVGKDSSGNVSGYAISVSSMEGYDGEVKLSVGILPDGTVTGISFTSIHETAGMGMLANTDSWKSQFTDKNVASFKLNKAGGSTADDEIDSVSGASITSGAVVNAVNAALDFFHNNIVTG